MTIIGDRKTWAVDNKEIRMGKGPLVIVRHPDGHASKMYLEDAVAAGLVPAAKGLPAGENKMMLPVEDKAAAHPPLENAGAGEAADDLTTIAGLGLASARVLVANGVTTFAQLRAAKNLSYLSKKAQAAVEAWRRV